MGGSFLGPFVAGLSGTLQQAQQRQTEQEYKKALIEHSKLQTKKLENELNLADLGRAYMASKGIPMPPPQTIAQPEPQAQSLLGRLFNPQLPSPQPVAAQQPLPQAIAQGQMQGQIPGMKAQGQPDDAFMEDLMQKKLFDMPPFRQRLEAESKQIGRAVTTMGPNGPMTILVDKMNRPMGAYPAVPEYQHIPVTGAGGQPGMMWYNKSMPGPAAGGGSVQGQGGPQVAGGGMPGFFQTGPAPTDLPKDLPEGTRSKIADINNVISSLTVLQNTLKPEYLGGKGYVGSIWDEWSKPLNEIGIPAGDVNRAAFHRTFNQMKRTEIKQSAGSAVSKQELGFVEAALPKLMMNEEVFKSAAGAIKMLLSMSAFEHAATAGGPSSQVYAKQARQIYDVYANDVKPRIEKALTGDANAFKDYQPPNMPMPNMNQSQGGLGPKPQLPNQQSISPAQAEQMLIQRGYKKNAQGQWVR